MGKRKSVRARPFVRRPEKLDTEFKCCFCNHPSSVEVLMDRKQWRGILSCRVCGVSFGPPIDSLSAPIDVYCAWLDACEAVNGGAEKAPKPPTPSLEDALNSVDTRFANR